MPGTHLFIHMCFRRTSRNSNPFLEMSSNKFYGFDSLCASPGLCAVRKVTYICLMFNFTWIKKSKRKLSFFLYGSFLFWVKCNTHEYGSLREKIESGFSSHLGRCTVQSLHEKILLFSSIFPSPRLWWPSTTPRRALVIHGPQSFVCFSCLSTSNLS